MKVAQAGLLSLMNFLIGYRRTALGPLWQLVGPALFVAFLGLLYAEIGSVQPETFIPHLAVGLVVWTLISQFVIRSATIYQRNRAQILQGTMKLKEVILVESANNVLIFLHQLPIVVAVFIIYRVSLSADVVVSLVGLMAIIANGIWVTQVFGILGARYRDLPEVFQAVMRIAFLATPILWMPSSTGRGSIMGAFLLFNPFYHFVEVVRAPLLGQPTTAISWMVVLGFTVIGFTTAHLMKKRYNKLVPLWI